MRLSKPPDRRLTFVSPSIAKRFGATARVLVLFVRSRKKTRHRYPERKRNIDSIDLVLADRKSVVSGKSVSVRVDLGGHRLIINLQHMNDTTRLETENISSPLAL